MLSSLIFWRAITCITRNCRADGWPSGLTVPSVSQRISRGWNKELDTKEGVEELTAVTRGLSWRRCMLHILISLKKQGVFFMFNKEVIYQLHQIIYNKRTTTPTELKPVKEKQSKKSGRKAMLLWLEEEIFNDLQRDAADRKISMQAAARDAVTTLLWAHGYRSCPKNPYKTRL